MNKKLLALFLVAPLVLASLAMAYQQTSTTQTTSASVGVNEFISITLSDPAGDVEVAFGDLNPDDADKPDLEQSTGTTTPAITVTNDAVSNVDIEVDVKGTDFGGPGANTIAVSAVTYDDDGDPSQTTETGQAETAMATGYPSPSYYTGVMPGSSVGFWFFIDVPSAQWAGDYTSTFTFRGQ